MHALVTFMGSRAFPVTPYFNVVPIFIYFSESAFLLTIIHQNFLKNLAFLVSISKLGENFNWADDMINILYNYQSLQVEHLFLGT